MGRVEAAEDRETAGPSSSDEWRDEEDDSVTSNSLSPNVAKEEEWEGGQEGEQPETNFLLHGILPCALSTACFATMSLFVKLSNKEFELGSVEAMYVRCCFQVCVALAALKYVRLPPLPSMAQLGPRERPQLGLESMSTFGSETATVDTAEESLVGQDECEDQRRLTAVHTLVAVRGVVDLIGVTSFYYAVSQLSLCLATVIYFTSPFFAGVIGRLYLREPFSCRQIGLALLCILGVGLASFGESPPSLSVAPPSPNFLAPFDSTVRRMGNAVTTPMHRRLEFTETVESVESAFRDVSQLEATKFVLQHAVPPENHWGALSVSGLLLAVVGAFCQGSTYCIIRKIGNRAHYLQLVFSFAMSGVLLTPILLVSVRGEIPRMSVIDLPYKAWLYCLAIGSFATMGQVLLNYGTQTVHASIAAIVRTLDICITLLLQWLFLGLPPNVLNVSGCAVVMLSCAGTAVVGKNRAARTTNTLR